MIGTLALIGFPGFSGFFSKDAIIEAVKISQLPGSGFAYIAVLLSVFVTALYSFRLLFMVFHGKERMDEHTRTHLRESPAVVTVPLILLALPAFVIGAMTVGPILFGGYFGNAIVVDPSHDTLAHLGNDFTGVLGFMMHGIMGAPFWLAIAGIFTAWYAYIYRTDLPGLFKDRLQALYTILDHKYGFDRFNEIFFAGGSRKLGRLFWKAGDQTTIDGFMVDGTARSIAWLSGKVRHIQTGFLYHYAFAMIIGLLVLITVFVIF